MHELSDLIQAVIDAAPGENTFGLENNYGYGDEQWLAQLENRSHPHISIGEAGGEFQARGPTPVEAVRRLLAKVRAGVRD